MPGSRSEASRAAAIGGRAALEALPSMRAWMAEALAEHQYIDWEEPYRDGR